jgi:hypothetical protein
MGQTSVQPSSLRQPSQGVGTRNSTPGSERTAAGLVSARARGHNGGRPYKMTPAKLRLATASMGKPDTNVGELCAEIGVTRQTLYRHVSPTGELRPDGLKLLTASRPNTQ